MKPSNLTIQTQTPSHIEQTLCDESTPTKIPTVIHLPFIQTSTLTHPRTHFSSHGFRNERTASQNLDNKINALKISTKIENSFKNCVTKVHSKPKSNSRARTISPKIHSSHPKKYISQAVSLVTKISASCTVYQSQHKRCVTKLHSNANHSRSHCIRKQVKVKWVQNIKS